MFHPDPEAVGFVAALYKVYSLVKVAVVVAALRVRLAGDKLVVPPGRLWGVLRYFMKTPAWSGWVGVLGTIAIAVFILKLDPRLLIVATLAGVVLGEVWHWLLKRWSKRYNGGQD
ncbi:MAG: hypothetical protein K1X83_13870 [Oligoflexia bacterium]|nr:hypothetical protein [Oligoflexia bacterium]